MSIQHDTIAELSERVNALEEEKSRLLLESETMNLFFDSAFELIAFKDSQLLYQKVNRNFCRYFGKDARDIIGSTDDQLFSPKDAQRYRVRDLNVIENRRQQVDNEYVEGIDGHTYFQVTNTPVFDSNDNVLGVLCTMRDSSDRRKTNLWAYAFDNCSHGIGITQPATNRVINCNQAYARILGLEIDEVEGKPLLSLYHPDEREQVLKYLQQSDTDGSVSYESRAIRTDGVMIPVQIDAKTVFDEYGVPVYRISTVQDITQRKNAEKKAKESLAQFNMVVESAPEAIFIQTNGCFAYLNPAALSMYGASEEHQLLGTPVLDRIHPEFRGITAERICRINHQRSMVEQNENVHLRCDGSSIDVEALAVPFLYKNQPSGLVFVRDISDRKKAEAEKVILEQELFHVQKLDSIGQLASGIAHEINNPLNFIKINYSNLSENVEDLKGIIDKYFVKVEKSGNDALDADKEVLSHLHEKAGEASVLLDDMMDIIADSLKGVTRISDIISSMRNYSHRNLGKEKKYCDINKVIQDVLVIARHEYKLVADVETNLEELLLVPCYPEQMHQVFLNLIMNSIQSIALQNKNSKGKISIHTWHDKEHVYCTISDNGSGIPAEICPRIFDPFFTTRMVGKGIGLGLSVSHDIIVNKHKGVISFECLAEGGTLFSIKLPLKNETP